MKNQLLQKSPFRERNFIEERFLKLDTLFFSTKNSSYILGKRNDVLFYKTDKLVLLLNEIFHFYLNFFDGKVKNFLFSDKKLIFLFGKEASLRSFQSILFGKYSGGIFSNNFAQGQCYNKSFNKADCFLFLSTKNPAFSLKESNSLKKPVIFFIEEKTVVENFLFYKTLLSSDSYFFNYFVLKLLSDFLLKIQIYNYIESKSVH